MTATMEEVTIAVCGSKAHAVRKLMEPLPELAGHVLGFAIGEALLPGVAPDTSPDLCRKCRAPAQVDLSDIRVRFRWGICLREQRLQMERNLARHQAYLESLPRLSAQRLHMERQLARHLAYRESLQR